MQGEGRPSGKAQPVRLCSGRMALNQEAGAGLEGSWVPSEGLWIFLLQKLGEGHGHF